MCDREMTLEEYVGQLMKDHRARKEFEEVKARIKQLEEAIGEAIAYIDEGKSAYATEILEKALGE